MTALPYITWAIALAVLAAAPVTVLGYLIGAW